MRTRRSPRNQEILWRQLGGGENEKLEPIKTVRCFDCVNYPKGGRSRGECTLIGEVVRGSNKDRKCFIPRSPNNGIHQMPRTARLNQTPWQHW